MFEGSRFSFEQQITSLLILLLTIVVGSLQQPSVWYASESIQRTIDLEASSSLQKSENSVEIIFGDLDLWVHILQEAVGRGNDTVWERSIRREDLLWIVMKINSEKILMSDGMFPAAQVDELGLDKGSQEGTRDRKEDWEHLDKNINKVVALPGVFIQSKNGGDRSLFVALLKVTAGHDAATWC